MVLYELSNLLLIYHYFKFEYYIAGAVIIALITGIILAKNYHPKTINHSEKGNPVTDLTNKEFQVLVMISEGKSNKEIASLNFVEISTIKTHINNIYFKLGVKDRKGAIEIYRQSLSTQKSTLSPPSVI
ncbi:MAG: DNA-binding response regulator [Mucilaginibacter sp.]|nr:DNA-binding response regulator [Mucilaginibacter sp.]